MGAVQGQEGFTKPMFCLPFFFFKAGDIVERRMFIFV